MNQPVPDELISAYFDGEVTPEERSQIEQLLESSSDLRLQLDDTSKLSALLHSFPREAAPQELAPNVRKQVEVAVPMTSPPEAMANASLASKGRRSLRREWTAFGAGMLATMASLLLFVAFHQSQTGSREGRSASSPTARFGRSESSVAEHNEWDEALPGVRLTSRLAGAMDSEADTRLAGTKVSTAPLAQVAIANSAEVPPNVDGNMLSYPEGWALQSQFLGELQAPSIRELNESLMRGDVILNHSLDPDNNIVVVEMTVIDVDRGANEMGVLLHKRNIPQVLTGASDDQRRLYDSTGRGADNKSASPDELCMFYVRASGTQLAETLSDSVESYPDNYVRCEPQLPMELRRPTFSDVSDVAARDEYGNANADPLYREKLNRARNAPANGLAKMDVVDLNGPGGPQTVAVEAKLALENYSVMNRLAVELPTDSPVPPAEKPSETASNKESSLGKSSQSKDRNSLPQEPSPDFVNRDKLALAITDSNRESQGYTTFRVAVDHQRPFGTNPSPAGQNSVVMNRALQSQNHFVFNSPIVSQGNSVVAGNNTNGFYGNSFELNPALGRQGQRSARQTTDPRLVRMLIVLKSGQPIPKPAP